MTSRRLDGISWFSGRQDRSSEDPGIRHSFMAGLATALNYLEGKVEPAWIMGTSAFSFRLYVNEAFCPSAQSVFDFSTILPEAVEQSGRCCEYVSRLWDEEELEEARRQKAQRAICRGLDRGAPAIVWDVMDAEWGLLTGYDSEHEHYEAVGDQGERRILPFAKLGRNGIDILSVAIPEEPNRRNRQEIIRRSLSAAVDHAEQKEWTERPAYQNGLAGYDLWARNYEKWSILCEAKRLGRLSHPLPPDLGELARYSADHAYSARFYAAEYLASIAGQNEPLRRAVDCYARVSSCLRAVWEFHRERTEPDVAALNRLAGWIRDAEAAEREGIACLKETLSFDG